MRFNLVPPEVTLAADDELALYGFTEARHGLVAFDRGGVVRAKIPGHTFGRPEIEEAIQAALQGE